MNNIKKGDIVLNSIVKKIKRWFVVKKQIRKIKKDFKRPKTFIY
jgi:hypothetical protein